MLDGDLPLKGPYFRRNPTSIVLQSKNTRRNRNQHIRFAQEYFLRPHLPQIHAETLAITGAVFFQLELRTQLFVWDSYGDFYFSNFDLTYFNKYRMDFNPVKCITKYEALTTINWNGSL